MELGLKRSLAFKNPAAAQITNGLHGLNINCTISLENTTNCEIGSSLWGSLTFPIYLPPSNVQNQNPSSFSSPKHSFWRHILDDSISTFCPIMVDISSSRSQIICQFSLYRFWLLLLPDSQPSALSASPRNTSLMIWINMGPAAHSNLNTLGNGNFSANQIRIHSPTSHHN